MGFTIKLGNTRDCFLLLTSYIFSPNKTQEQNLTDELGNVFVDNTICVQLHTPLSSTNSSNWTINHVLYQLAAYLLISSSSVAVTAIQHNELSTALKRATIVSVCMSFSAFVVTAACALLSGYKLCTRIIW